MKKRGRPKNNNGTGQESSDLGQDVDLEEIKESQQQNLQVIKEKKFSHGQSLPKSTVIKVITEKLQAMGNGIKLAPQSIDVIVDLAVGFLDHVADQANIECMNQKRQMLTPEHVFEAMNKMNLQEYLQVMSADDQEQKTKPQKKTQSVNELRTRVMSRLDSLCDKQRTPQVDHGDNSTPELSEEACRAAQAKMFAQFNDPVQQQQVSHQPQEMMQQPQQIYHNQQQNEQNHMPMQKEQIYAPNENQQPYFTNTTDYFADQIEMTKFIDEGDDVEMEEPHNFWDQFTAQPVQNLQMPGEIVDQQMIVDLEVMEFVPSRQNDMQFQIELMNSRNQSMMKAPSVISNSNAVQRQLSDHEDVVIDVDANQLPTQQKVQRKKRSRSPNSPQSGSKEPIVQSINSNTTNSKKVHNNKN